VYRFVTEDFLIYYIILVPTFFEAHFEKLKIAKSKHFFTTDLLEAEFNLFF